MVSSDPLGKRVTHVALPAGLPKEMRHCRREQQRFTSSGLPRPDAQGRGVGRACGGRAPWRAGLPAVVSRGPSSVRRPLVSPSLGSGPMHPTSC